MLSSSTFVRFSNFFFLHHLTFFFQDYKRSQSFLFLHLSLIDFLDFQEKKQKKAQDLLSKVMRKSGWDPDSSTLSGLIQAEKKPDQIVNRWTSFKDTGVDADLRLAFDLKF